MPPRDRRSEESEITFKVFEYVETGKVDADGRSKKRISLVEKRTVPQDLFN
jgi:hypothetical protein